MSRRLDGPYEPPLQVESEPGGTGSALALGWKVASLAEFLLGAAIAREVLDRLLDLSARDQLGTLKWDMYLVLGLQVAVAMAGLLAILALRLQRSWPVFLFPATLLSGVVTWILPALAGK